MRAVLLALLTVLASAAPAPAATPPTSTPPPSTPPPSASCGPYCDTRDPALPPDAQRTTPPVSTVPPTAPVNPAAAICDKYCDARDPALAAGDRIAQTVTDGGRTIGLHLDDGDDMGWAVTDNGGQGDEVWLDRSFDNGRTWSSGSKLGDTTVPAGYGGWRTLMYNVDDWNNLGVGLVRACG
ncbi:MAG TPA: hypothetical protein VHF06_24345, partial [Pseudonocardiaceae bacterium]|nr:hypothetical protein [Pseudonocardiaceae bacterium]